MPYGAYGVQEAQAGFNRPAYTGQLVQEWLPAVPDLHATLTRGGAIAELGSGAGWAAIALARGYPDLRVDGFDWTRPRSRPPAGTRSRLGWRPGSIRRRRRHRSGADGCYDAVFAFEVVHDLAHPVEALRTARRITSGPVIVVDERVAETFHAPADPMERFFYAASVLHCLPVGRCERRSAATGTVMRPDTAAQLRRCRRVRAALRAADRERHVPLLPAGAMMGTTEALLDGWEDTTPSGDTLVLAAVRAMADRATRWASAAGGRIRADTGLVLADSGSPCPFLNVATALVPSTLQRRADHGFFGGALRPRHPATRPRISGRRPRPVGHPPSSSDRRRGSPALALGMSPSPRCATRQVSRPWIARWPPAIRSGSPTRHPAGWRTRFWLARADGEPAATAVSHTAHGVIDVEAVATLPGPPWRGLGAAVTWAATLADPRTRRAHRQRRQRRHLPRYGLPGGLALDDLGPLLRVGPNAVSV